MLNEINYNILDEQELKEHYGKGSELGMGLVATFVIVAVVTVLLYKIYNSKSGDITLPGGYKFKFTSW